MPKQIRKRDGRLETWSVDRIAQAIFKALKVSDIKDPILAKRLAHKVEIKLEGMDIPEQEQVQDIVEKVLMESRLYNVAKRYILYREKRRTIRSQKEAFLDIMETIDAYLNKSDWRVNRERQHDPLLSGADAASLRHGPGPIRPGKISLEIRQAHEHGYFHIHDLSFGLAGYCAGWSLRDLLLEGFNLEGRSLRARPIISTPLGPDGQLPGHAAERMGRSPGLQQRGHLSGAVHPA
jgi:ribonucleoside-triphosphate reductase (formate)